MSGGGGSRGGAFAHGHRLRPLSAAGGPTAAAGCGGASWLTSSIGTWGSAAGADVASHHPPASYPYHTTYSTSPAGRKSAAAAAGHGSSSSRFGGGRAAAGGLDAPDVYGGLDVRLGPGGDIHDDGASSVSSQGSQYDAWQQELSFRVGSALRKLEQPVL